MDHPTATMETLEQQSASTTMTETPSTCMPNDPIAANQERCAKILECKSKINALQEQLDDWNSKLKALEDEQRRLYRLASLKLNAKEAWQRLDEDERNDKEYILAALESKELPEDLDDFCNGDFPPCIRMDRDILLARVSREDFEARYRDERLFVPPRLRGDKEVILKIV
ncbi:MAG: hypothetical protein SGARI_000779, partial [Bacillariaceae sp.]